MPPPPQSPRAATSTTRDAGAASDTNGRAARVTTAGANFTAFIDRFVVEVFVGAVGGLPGPVISSGVFNDLNDGDGRSDGAKLEVFCKNGAAATVDAVAWNLAA